LSKIYIKEVYLTMLKSYNIIDKYINNRLDVALCDIANYTRNQVKIAIKNGLVSINNKKITKPSTKLQYMDKVVLYIKEQNENENEKNIYNFKNNSKFDIKTIYEDEFILVLNKPNGLIIHQASTVREPTLVDWLKSKNISLSTLSGEVRYGIVHRLDKGTTGAMVVAKTNNAHENLSAQLQNKTMGRFYVAIIDKPLKNDIIINKPIGRDNKNRIKMSTSNPTRVSKTAFKKILVSNDETMEMVVCKLYTGRTHQIRAHLNFINRHIIGDFLYDYKGKYDKIHLHAFMLYLNHPTTGQRLTFKAQFDSEFKDFIKQNFNTRSDFEKVNDYDFDNMFDDIG